MSGNLDHGREVGQNVFRTGKRTTALSHIGYARVSTLDQNPALQLDALAAAGCAKVFEDRASGAKADRAGLAAAISYVRDGDVLIVWKLDRLGRSLPHLIETITTLEKRGVGFRSVTEAIDTTTPGGRLVFHLFGALGQFERDLIQERTRAGLVAAAARGRKGGRSRSWCRKSYSGHGPWSPVDSPSAKPQPGSRSERQRCTRRCAGKKPNPDRSCPAPGRTE